VIQCEIVRRFQRAAAEGRRSTAGTEVVVRADVHRTVADGRAPTVAVCAAEGQPARAVFGQRAVAADDPGERCAGVVEPIAEHAGGAEDDVTHAGNRADRLLEVVGERAGIADDQRRDIGYYEVGAGRQSAITNNGRAAVNVGAA